MFPFLSDNSTDLSPRQIVDVVKQISLNNEEIQMLIDALLNKQDGSAEWQKVKLLFSNYFLTINSIFLTINSIFFND